jgi:cyclopropane fatty-acyl-phospholipid synthase-like methyltransferase
MHNVSGLQNESDFASHGADFFLALSAASPIALTEYRRILDFGCGCGRLARMFKGHPSRISACDVDGRHVKWVGQSLSYVDVRQTSVHPPLPYGDNEFDAIVSISVFTHLGEKSQDEFLAELHRISSRTGYLFLTVHGACALERALNEPQVRDMIAVDEKLFQDACLTFAEGQHAFILQQGHLTSFRKTRLRRFFSWITNQCVIHEPFEYGITFIPESYIRQHWGKWFDVVDYRAGAIHSFQDIVVLRPRK